MNKFLVLALFGIGLLSQFSCSSTSAKVAPVSKRIIASDAEADCKKLGGVYDAIEKKCIENKANIQIATREDCEKMEGKVWVDNNCIDENQPVMTKEECEKDILKKWQNGKCVDKPANFSTLECHKKASNPSDSVDCVNIIIKSIEEFQLIDSEGYDRIKESSKRLEDLRSPSGYAECGLASSTSGILILGASTVKYKNHSIDGLSERLDILVDELNYYKRLIDCPEN